MDRNDLKRILPHHEPMLLVDKVEVDGDWVNAEYKVRVTNISCRDTSLECL